MANSKYIDRFFEESEAPEDIVFDLNLGDVVSIDGALCLITAHGGYENQYWTEKLYGDGIHLGAGNYRIATKRDLISDREVVKRVKDAYRRAITENYNEFLSDRVDRTLLTQHLQSVIGRR